MTRRRVAHALFALAAGLAGAACAHTPRADAAKTETSHANSVLALASAARAAGRPAIVIFGLDGTLLDPSARTREIFSLAFDGPDPVVNPSRPDLSTAIRALPLSEFEPDPVATLAKIGVTDSAFVRAVMTRWNQDSFSNRFLTRDEPVPGAVSFVDSLYVRGCTIVYFSGRDARRTLAGTAQSLFERGFPVAAPRTMLILKPERTTPDSAYTARALDDLAVSGTVVAVFENDPGRVRALHARFPGALAVHVERKPATGAPAPAPGIATAKDFTEFQLP